jgi:transposase InsO family protein
MLPLHPAGCTWQWSSISSLDVSSAGPWRPPLTRSLVEQALSMALTRRKPGAGLLHHSDRGCQYTSEAYQSFLKQHDIQVSMSRKGNCWDNAVMERFFGTLKRECTSREHFKTHEEARTAIFEYIEAFYNRVRKHSTLGYLSPVHFELVKS